MFEWIKETFASTTTDPVARRRLTALIEKAFELRQGVNAQRETPDTLVELKTQNGSLIQSLRVDINESIQLPPAVRLRIQQRGMGGLRDWGRESTREALEVLIENFEIERREIESRMNFRIAVFSAALSAAAAILAFVSLIVTMIALVWHH